MLGAPKRNPDNWTVHSVLLNHSAIFQQFFRDSRRGESLNLKLKPRENVFSFKHGKPWVVSCVSGIWWDIREIYKLKDKEFSAQCPDCGHKDVFFGVEAVELYHGELPPARANGIKRRRATGI
jgi:hypothetical protein